MNVRDVIARTFEARGPRAAVTKPPGFAAQEWVLSVVRQAFDVGAVFRDSTSSLEGDMVWTYGNKPRITVGPRNM